MKGDIVQDRIKELILVQSDGEMSIYEPSTDVGGIDLVVLREGQFQPILLQVKSSFRFRETRHGLVFNVEKRTFGTHIYVHVLCAVFNLKSRELEENLLLVPSKEIPKREMCHLTKDGSRYVIRVPSLKDTHRPTKWKPYFVKKAHLVDALHERFNTISEYQR